MAERRLSWNNQTVDGWAIEGNPLFNTEWVQCFYPISGGYGRTPRYLFLALALFAVLQKEEHLDSDGAALGSVMTYSATAALHAIELVAYGREWHHNISSMSGWRSL